MDRGIYSKRKNGLGLFTCNGKNTERKKRKERKKEEDEERKNRIKIQSDIKAKQKYMEETDEM